MCLCNLLILKNTVLCIYAILKSFISSALYGLCHMQRVLAGYHSGPFDSDWISPEESVLFCGYTCTA